MKSRRLIFRLMLGTVMASALSLALLPQSALAQAKPSEYVIGTTLPLTGVGAFYGEVTKKAADLAAKEINAAGGINGVPLRLVHEDSQLQPKAGVTAFQKLVDVHKVPVVVTAGSAVVLAQAPISRERKILLANLAATSPKLRKEGQWLYTFILTSDIEARSLARMVADEYKFKEYGMIHVESDYGQDFATAMIEAMNQKGVKLLAREQHPVGAVDFRTNLIKIKGANPPALMIFSNITEVGHIVNQIREIGIKSEVFGSTMASSADNLKIAPTAMNGVKGVMVAFTPDRNARAKSFAAAYKKEFNMEPNVHAAITYDTIHLLANAIKAVGYEAEAMRKYLANAKGLTGVMGNLDLDADRVVQFDVVKWTVKDGKLVVVK